MGRAFVIARIFRVGVSIIAFENLDHVKLLTAATIKDYKTHYRYARNAEELAMSLGASGHYKILESMNTVMPWPDYMPVISSKESLSLVIAEKTLSDILADKKFERNVMNYLL